MRPVNPRRHRKKQLGMGIICFRRRNYPQKWPWSVAEKKTLRNKPIRDGETNNKSLVINTYSWMVPLNSYYKIELLLCLCCLSEACCCSAPGPEPQQTHGHVSVSEAHYSGRPSGSAACSAPAQPHISGMYGSRSCCCMRHLISVTA